MAIRRPRYVALGMQRIGSACADAPWWGARLEIFYVDDGAAGTRSTLGMHRFNPGDEISVRRDGDLFKGVRSEERTDNAIERSDGLWLLCGFKPPFNILGRAGFVLRERLA